MAGILAVLRTVGRLALRDLRTLNAAGTNNFFLFCLFLMQAGAFLQVIFGLLILFPLSADPLRRVPVSRWLLWPFSPGQRLTIRLGSFLLSPAAWITGGIMFIGARPGMGLRFAALSISIGIATVAFSALADRIPSINPLRSIPGFPGPLGGLVRKDLREFLSLLDPYCALVLAVAGVLFRVFSKEAGPDATMGMSLLVVLALSTYSQLLFGLDSDSGLTRYALMPLAGWKVLASKDAAFLLVLIPLVLPLSPLTGLSSGFVALAIGHHTTVTHRVQLHRWRFAGGGPWGMCVFQSMGLLSAGVMTAHDNSWFVIPCAAAWLGSLFFYGRMFEKRTRF